MTTLGEELPKEMARVRDEVMPEYIKIGPPGQFALALMRTDLDLATKALADQDVIEMARALAALKAYQL